MGITEQMIKDWVDGNVCGQFLTRDDYMLDVLKEIANGIYEPTALVRDIIAYNEGEI